MNIFDITQEIEKLEKLLSETDFNEEIESVINAKTEMLEQLKKDFENKVLAYRHIFKKMEMLCSMWKNKRNLFRGSK